MAAPKTGPRPTLEKLPPEIMTMILECSELHYNAEYNIDEGNFATETSKPILEATDIFSLRLASRQLEYKSLDAFGKRFFAVRNHMLSRRSVQCLREISASPKLSRYVKEVVIAPLRISPDMAQYKEKEWRYEWESEVMRGDWYDIAMDEEDGLEVEEKVKRRQERKEKRLKQTENKLQDKKEKWSLVHEPKWRALVHDQAAFDTKCVVQVQRALKSLANLQQVHLAAFPFSKGRWDDTWGAKSLVRDLEVDLGPDWNDVAHVLEDDILRFRDKGLPAHLETMLQALEGIKDQKNWSLNIVFDSPLWYYKKDPNHMNTDLWRRLRGRVQSLEFKETGCDGPDGEENEGWFVNLLRSCKNLTKVTLDQVYYSHYFLSVLQKHAVRHLVLDECYIPNNSLALFLDEHSTTLAEIEIWWVRLMPYQELAYNKQGKPHSTWITLQETMLEMPRLKKVDLRVLRQSFLTGGESYVQPHDMHESKSYNEGVNHMTAYSGGIAKKLRRVIDESYNTCAHNIFRFEDIHFVELQFPSDI